MKIFTVLIAFLISVVQVGAYAPVSHTYTYTRNTVGDAPAKLVLKVTGNKCKFTVSTQGASRLFGVDGSGILNSRGTIVYINPEMNDPDDHGTVTLQKVNGNTILVSGGAGYCDPYTTLEGTYRLVSTK